MRGHYAVGFHQVGSREKNHEWTRISSIHEAVPLILCVFRGLNCFNIFRVHLCAFVVQTVYSFSCVSCFSWFKIVFHSRPIIS